MSSKLFKECSMQDTTLSRWLTPVMAFCLSFVMISTLAPTVGIQIDRQFDFWLLWLGTMLLLALPIGFLENCLSETFTDDRVTSTFYFNA